MKCMWLTVVLSFGDDDMAESSTKKNYLWTDDEAELHSTPLLKVKKEMECEDWEALKARVSREPIRPHITSTPML